MSDSQKSVFVDDEVASQVLDIVQEAQQYAIIVTPFLKLWRHSQRALELAAKKGIQVTVIVRSENGVLKNVDDLTWLLDNGIQVLSVEYLHAKIYLNEHAVIVSSMNFYDFSTNNSLEIGLIVEDERASQQVRDYVTNTLKPLAVPFSLAQAEPSPQTVSGPTQAYGPTELGHCIRCGRPISPNLSKPLCGECYDVWAEYGNEDYLERYCHACGKPAEVTHAKPLCRECFQKLRSIL